ncbi:hypothetical protein FXF61_12415 [Pseudomonas sp. C27(2019)]|uniref:ABC-three component system middle component 5 n=1 Tax=Pseudomonas sp. C27(2019) TaxID=2604941 RepID=UPI0012486004|nr:ABC-three component system middle component 5 [Pseudomonas sp. C27(2019)]QEY59905.1 hypothetical protein FXF61_12415 [Pseudomonas sp. C27(2019)]
MLIYHPAQDINHCVYRLLLILEFSEHEKLSIDVYRMIDFYTLFPSLLKLITPLPQSLSTLRKEFSNIPEPFESLRNIKRILYELESFQSTAIQNLIAKELLSKEDFESGFLKRTEKGLLTSFMEQALSGRLVSERWFQILINEFPKVKFAGRDGLKSRTGLMEYRYDMVKA